ncbi:response regulator transcription factor [Paenarthrobacter sp. PH39-S1]|uniref:response regulator transcription factor n=1 Tax=Paenarthrobacter sp. PH39-S1 TaxID=3046204 RepID=UPI0024B8AF5A|nr:response regulator transcription factor [Paenarthrobacter sp. PH39-S1]MDJ0356105.1 response regulator transcription factor [Paenarthrobacter sp. PH39-S1]
MDSPRIAVVIEDDSDIRDLIEMILAQSGFEVHSVRDGAAGVTAVRRHKPSIVTLDLGLPDIDGFEVARRIRLFSDSYIIMLTARADELDTLLGLESGADDYLTKPFRPRELRARVSAMLRRPRAGGSAEGASSVDASSSERPMTASPSHAAAAAVPLNGPAAPPAGPAGSGLAGSGPAGSGPAGSGTPPPPAAGSPAVEPPAAGPATHGGASEAPESGSLIHNGLLVNGSTRTAAVHGSELALTRTEFDLLHALMESGKLVRTKADLVRRLRNDEYDAGGYISDADERTIEVHMANLRRKLGDNSKSPRWVKTVRGVGYRLAP